MNGMKRPKVDNWSDYYWLVNWIKIQGEDR